MEALSEDLLHAGLPSALSMTAGDAWPAKVLGDGEDVLLRSIFTGDALDWRNLGRYPGDEGVGTSHTVS